jgi:predicted transcriptional regulator
MRRNEVEIKLDILEVLLRNKSLKLTHIMYKTNVNCSVLKAILKDFTTKGLIVETSLYSRRETGVHNRTRKMFSLTPKGVSVLRWYKEVKDILI